MRRAKLYTSIIVYITHALWISVFAQKIPMRSYTTDDGLVQSDVWACYQDHHGYMWFGTSSGLSRFDGKTFKTFNQANSGLGGNVVSAIVEDAGHNLWVGFNGGVGRLAE